MFRTHLIKTIPSFRLITSSSSTFSSIRLFSTSHLNLSTSTTTEGSIPEQPRLLSYFIKRTSGGSLPVYAEVKEGGAKTYTIIRKIDGSLEAFREDLSKHLPTAVSRIKPQARQVVLTGDWVKETKEYLSAGGF